MGGSPKIHNFPNFKCLQIRSGGRLIFDGRHIRWETNSSSCILSLQLPECNECLFQSQCMCEVSKCPQPHRSSLATYYHISSIMQVSGNVLISTVGSSGSRISTSSVKTCSQSYFRFANTDILQ